MLVGHGASQTQVLGIFQYAPVGMLRHDVVHHFASAIGGPVVGQDDADRHRDARCFPEDVRDGRAHVLFLVVARDDDRQTLGRARVVVCSCRVSGFVHARGVPSGEKAWE